MKPSAFYNRAFLAVFTLVLLLVAAVFAVPIVFMARDQVRAARWNRAPAQVLDVQLEEDSRSVTFGRTSVTDALRIRFSYQAAGKQYEGVTRWHFVPDNVARREYATLSEDRTLGKTIVCSVNPADPQQSAVFAPPRWGFYFGEAAIVCLLIGAAVAPHVVRLSGRKRPSRGSQSSGDSVAEVRSSLALPGVKALLLGGILGLSCFVILMNVFAQTDSLGVQILVLTVILVPLLFAARAFLYSQIFRSTLKLQSVPSRPGERLLGVIRTWVPFPPDMELQLVLHCRAILTKRVSPVMTQLEEIDVYDQDVPATPVTRRLDRPIFGQSWPVKLIRSVRVRGLRNLFATSSPERREAGSLLEPDVRPRDKAVSDETLLAAADGWITSEIPVDILLQELRPTTHTGPIHYRWTLTVHAPLNRDLFRPSFTLPIRWR
jgi:hypothetical protein